MRSNSSNNKMHGFDAISSSKVISSKLKEIKINKIAKQTLFQKGHAQKISPLNFLVGFFLMAFSNGRNTLEGWAGKISFLTGGTLSRQAIFKKMNERQIEFLKSVLSNAIDAVINKGEKFREITPKLKVMLRKFKNIYLEDSTCIQLNKVLSRFYPGNANQYKTEKSIMRLDIVYNLTRGFFRRFFITNFRINDLVNARDILDIVKKGDLVIRDLGYFLVDVFRQIMEKKAFFLSRLRPQINVYDAKTGLQIDLYKLLKRKNFLDKMVLIGRSGRLPVRLIVVKLDSKVVEQKKRRITNRRYKHSEEYMRMLDFAMFITNCPDGMLSLEEVVELYRLRWRIEIIIKAWKSHLDMTEVITCKNKIRVDSYFYCMLIFIVLFMTDLFIHFEEFITRISLLKFYKFIAENFFLVINILSRKPLQGKSRKMRLDEEVIRKIKYYCSYENRKDRVDFYQLVLENG
jgi:hypothetical protein